MRQEIYGEWMVCDRNQGLLKDGKGLRAAVLVHLRKGFDSRFLV